MNLNEYQEKIKITAIYPEATDGSFEALNYVIVGLMNEAGEVGGKLKKCIRDNKKVLDKKIIDGILDECSDVLWYLARTIDELGVTMEELADINYNKLISRKERGVLSGSGDLR